MSGRNRQSSDAEGYRETIDSVERYDCPPGGCKPPTIGDGAGWLSTCKYLPNDGLWLWRCGHGRPFFLCWERGITTTELKEVIDASR